MLISDLEQNIVGYLASSQTGHNLFVKVNILSNVNLRPRTEYYWIPGILTDKRHHLFVKVNILSNFNLRPRAEYCCIPGILTE